MTSQFLGCGKKTAWAAWTSIPDLTDTIVALTHDPGLFSLESIHMQRIERLVIVVYSKGCSAARVNADRRQLFTTGSKMPEKIPPTKATLFKHVKRGLLQASFYWRQATSVQQEIPDFSELHVNYFKYLHIRAFFLYFYYVIRVIPQIYCQNYNNIHWVTKMRVNKFIAHLRPIFLDNANCRLFTNLYF